MKPCCKILIIIFFIFFLQKNLVAQTPDSTQRPPNSDEVVPALNFKDTDIRDILRALALEYKTNIVVDNRINKRVSVALFEIKLFDAIKIITEDNQLLFTYDGTRFIINEVTPVAPPAPPPPKEPEADIKFDRQTDKINISSDNVEISAFVKKLREKTGKNYLLTQGTSGKITGTLTDINLVTGLKNLLQNNGFLFTEKDSIYYISKMMITENSKDQPGTNPQQFWVNIHDDLISLDVSNMNLDQIINELANKLNLQIIKLDIPKANVTVKCTDVPLDLAMYYLFKGSGFTYKKENEAYIIGKADQKNMDSMIMYKLKHLMADKVVEQVSGKLFPGVSIQKIIEHNALMIIGPQEQIVALEDYLKLIDKPVPQVMIEALVVDYNLDDLFESGFSAGTGDTLAASRADQWFPGLDVTASGAKINSILKDIGQIDLFGNKLDLAKVKLPDDFYANIKFLESNGLANIRSRPLLSTLNGHTASLKIGTTQNYVFDEILPVTNQLSSTFIQKESIQSIEANISFEITPWVGPDNELTLEIKPDFQTPVGKFSPDKKTIPSINRRTLESTVRLKGGETIILGGLIQDEETTTVNKFPILGDIPIIGEFFTNRKISKNKAELVIYVTPRIFYEDQVGYSYYDYAD